MAKPMNKAKVIATLAVKTGLARKEVSNLFAEFTALAYREARNSFTIPGIGKLALVKRKARKGRNPQTGETIRIPAKKVVKFRVAKACKDAVLGGYIPGRRLCLL